MPWVPTSKLVMLFGASTGTENWLKMNRETSPLYSYLILDNNSSIWGDMFNGIEVCSPKVVQTKEFSKIIIAFSHTDQVIPQLISLDVPRESIILPPTRLFTPAKFDSKDARENAWSLLCSVGDILTANNITFIIEQGVALGFWRDRDFIANDQDIDVSISQQEIETHEQLNMLAKEIKRSNMVSSVNINAGQISNSLSVVSIDGIPMSIFGRRNERNISHGSYSFESVPIDLLYPPCSIKIRDRWLPLPGDCPGYLAYVYGENWKIPNPNFRYTDYANNSAQERDE